MVTSDSDENRSSYRGSSMPKSAFFLLWKSSALILTSFSNRIGGFAGFIGFK